LSKFGVGASSSLTEKGDPDKITALTLLSISGILLNLCISE
jgi:hypothetical protein